MSDRLYALQEFFLGYFHPDWMVDSGTRGDAVDTYLGSSESASLPALRAELRSLLDRPLTEPELHELVLKDYSLFYDPWRDEISMREWLEGLFQELSRGEADSPTP